MMSDVVLENGYANKTFDTRLERIFHILTCYRNRVDIDSEQMIIEKILNNSVVDCSCCHVKDNRAHIEILIKDSVLLK